MGDTSWYLRVKTLNDVHLVEVGPNAEEAKAALLSARKLMRETGAVTIAGALVVNASDIESIALQDADAAGRAS